MAQSAPLRNQKPFLQIFGLPTFQSASLADRDSLDLHTSFDIVSHADPAMPDFDIHLTIRRSGGGADKAAAPKRRGCGQHSLAVRLVSTHFANVAPGSLATATTMRAG